MSQLKKTTPVSIVCALFVLIIGEVAHFSWTWRLSIIGIIALICGVAWVTDIVTKAKDARDET